MSKRSMNSFLIYSSICCCLIHAADGVTLTFEMKSNLPVKGSTMEFSCRMSEPFISGGIRIWKGTSEVTTCYGEIHRCNFYNNGYIFTANNTGAFVVIRSLYIADEGTWRCSYITATVGDTYSNTLDLIVYTIPSGLYITQNPNHDVDLTVNSVEIQCKTLGCTYPLPIIIWKFKDQTTSLEYTYATVNSTGLQESCTAHEKIYTSTLQLPRYGTFTDNSDKTGSFYCRIEYTDASKNIESNASYRVRFAGAPKILDIPPEYKGYVGHYTIVQFDVYSNGDQNLTITAQHSNFNGLIYPGIIEELFPDRLPFYSSPRPDFRASIAIYVRRENDFGQYLVQVINNIASNLTFIRIDENILPEKPINFHANNIQERQLSLMWQSGYHGRFPQTFVVETSQDNITWTNVSLVSDGNRDGWFTTVIEDLNPGSKYYLRLYGYNKNGRGEFADDRLEIKMWTECLYPPSQVESTPDGIGIGVGGAVGVGAGGVVGVGAGGVVLGCVGVIIVYTIRRCINGDKSCCFSSKGKTEEVTYSNTEMTLQPVKPIYEELSKGNVEHNMYDKISPS